MDWNRVGRWVLLAGSLVIGMIGGMGGIWIFEAKVPAAMQTAMLKTEVRVYYLLAAVVLGFLIYAWAMLGVSIATRSAATKARRDGATR